MAPEENIETTDDLEPEFHGDVETVEGDEETLIEEGDVSVVVAPEQGTDAVDAAIVEAAIDSAREQGEQASELDQLRETVREQGELIETMRGEISMLSGLAVAEAAVIEEVAEEETEEGSEEDPEEDEEKNGEPVAEDRSEPRSAGAHPLFRSWGDWRGRNR